MLGTIVSRPTPFLGFSEIAVNMTESFATGYIQKDGCHSAAGTLCLMHIVYAYSKYEIDPNGRG